MSEPRIRVAGYVIRRTDAGSELLVFDHVGIPAAGTQVPAGGVHPDERLRDAVVREIREETGLADVEVIAELGTEDKPHPDTGEPRRTTYFHLRAVAGTPDRWRHQVDGDGADAGLLFACRFEPLPLPGPLVDQQDVFLGRIDPGPARRDH